jgi:hypothetical protein
MRVTRRSWYNERAAGMPVGELTTHQPALPDKKEVDCVEVYLPKTIQFLSQLYQMLRDKTTNRWGNVVLDGFSIYEVDGVFTGRFYGNSGRLSFVCCWSAGSQHQPIYWRLPFSS